MEAEPEEGKEVVEDGKGSLDPDSSAGTSASGALSGAEKSGSILSRGKGEVGEGSAFSSLVFVDNVAIAFSSSGSEASTGFHTTSSSGKSEDPGHSVKKSAMW